MANAHPHEDADDSRAVLFERAARFLPLNTADDLQAFRGVVSRIVANIQENPEDLKYRSLKLSNKTLRGKVFDKAGAAECMTLLGFRRSMRALTEHQDGTEAYLVYDGPPAPMLGCKEWLDEQIDTALDVSAHTGSCAECILQFRLPSGRTIRGAFFSGETLGSAQSFVETFKLRGGAESDLRVEAPAQEEWKLVCPDTRQPYMEAELSRTLVDAKLAPRATLLVDCPGHAQSSARQATDPLTASREVESQQRAKQHVKRQQEKLKNAKEEREHRQRILGEFVADREEARERKRAPIPADAADATAS